MPTIVGLDDLKINYDGFRRVCKHMFTKLKGTAAFMGKLIRNLEQDSDDDELLAKIKAIQLDLNGSMKDTSIMMQNVAGNCFNDYSDYSL